MNKLKLKEEFITKLSALPETGHGYHVVNIKLLNGNELKQRVVINSTYLKLYDDETITDEITEITLA